MKKFLAAMLVQSSVVMPALGLPFNQDMVNHQKITGSMMRPQPDGAVAIGSLDRQIKNEEQISSWENPRPGDSTAIAKGNRLFIVNCAPCHGTFKDGTHAPAVIQAKGMPSINLADEAIVYLDPGVRAKPKGDGHFFNYIYNGGALMPPYGYKLSNDEIWNIVSYIRFIQGEAATSRAGTTDSGKGGK